MVEIPEHLLKRSQEARARATGSSGPAPAAASESESAAPDESPPAQAPAAPPAAPPVAATPVAAPSTAPPPAVPIAAMAVSGPERIYGPASTPSGMRRRGSGAKVPGWLIPVYFIVPILALALIGAFISTGEVASTATKGPDGKAIYAQYCAQCHGPTGGGGAGPAMKPVNEVFPNFDEHVAWVNNVANKASGPFGINGNEGKGATPGLMPAFEGTLTPEEIRAVVIFERVTFGGASPDSIPAAAAAVGAPGPPGEGAAGAPPAAEKPAGH